MRIGEVIGTITLCRSHPALAAGRFPVAVPLTLDNLTGRSQRRGEPLVVFDELGAGHGHLIAISEGAEAAQPFYPDFKPLDAYAAAILDTLDVKPLD